MGRPGGGTGGGRDTASGAAPAPPSPPSQSNTPCAHPSAPRWDLSPSIPPRCGVGVTVGSLPLTGGTVLAFPSSPPPPPALGSSKGQFGTCWSFSVQRTELEGIPCSSLTTTCSSVTHVWGRTDTPPPWGHTGSTQQPRTPPATPITRGATRGGGEGAHFAASHLALSPLLGLRCCPAAVGGGTGACRARLVPPPPQFPRSASISHKAKAGSSPKGPPKPSAAPRQEGKRARGSKPGMAGPHSGPQHRTGGVL